VAAVHAADWEAELMGVQILSGDCREVLRALAARSVHCCVTSPPYFGLRDYGVDGQIGLEQTPDAYVAELVAVFREVRRVLRDDGTLWLNLGDSYANDGKWGGHTGGKHVKVLHCSPIGRNKRYTGLKPKDLIGIPWMVAFALRADGWWLRQDIIWSKPAPMPESVTDRCTKAHEYLFMLSKSERYYYDADAIAEPITDSSRARMGQPNLAQQNGSDRVPGKTNGNMKAVLKKQDGHGRRYAGFNERFFAGECAETRNKRSVWTVATQPYSEAHFATFPPALIEPCIKAGTMLGGTVLDPFGGSGTTAMVADRLGRAAILIELNPTYVDIAKRRIHDDAGMFADINEKGGHESPPRQKGV
jgi:DNA modification methylase